MSTDAALDAARIRTVSIRLLGELRASAGAREVALQPGRVATLLALLALEPGRVISAQRLLDQLWEDDPPPSGMAALYVYVSRLRKQLEPLGIAITTRAPGYMLHVDPTVVDVMAFTQAMADTEHALDHGDPRSAQDLLRTARDLWRGEPFEGASACPDLVIEAQRLQRLRERLSGLDAKVLLATGQARAAADLAQTLTEREPLNEAHWGVRIQAERDAGNTAVALALYEQFRADLADELGIDPGARLRELHTALLREDAAAPDSPAPQAPPAPEAAVSIGRATHLRDIDASLRAAVDGRGTTIVLEGPAGVGKTYLAERAAQLAERFGIRTAWTRTVEGTGAPPLWPWQRILASLPRASGPSGAGELAALQEDTGTPADADEARFALSQALVTRVLAAAREGPLLLVFDDLQWADAPTAHAVGLLTSALRTTGCVVVLTVRQPLVQRPAISTLLASLHGDSTTRRLRVAEFTLDEITEEVQRSRQLSADDARRVAVGLRDRTGGNAFFLTELLAADDEQALPVSIAEMVAERLSQLSSSRRDFVDIAAVAGLHVDVPLMARALDLSVHDVMKASDELCGIGLLRSDSTEYSFSHSLARDAVLSALPRSAAARIHTLVGDALEDQHADDTETALEAIAFHRFRGAAGAVDERAYLACSAAADRARASLAFDQAAVFRERALSSVPVDERHARRRADTLLALIGERRAAGDVVGAAAALRQALRAARQLNDSATTVHVLSLLGEVTLWNWRQYGEVDADTIDLLNMLLQQQPPLPELEQIDLSIALAMECYYADEADRSRAAALANDAAVRASAREDAVRRSRAYSARVFSVWRPDSEPDRLAVLDEWLAPADGVGTLPGEVVARLHRASIHLVRGNIDGWSIDIERAGELLSRAGRAEYVAQHTAQLGCVALQAGRLDEARDLMKRTVTTMRRTSMWGTAWVTWMQKLTLARIEGRTGDIADELLAAAAAEAHRPLRWAAVLALAEAGRTAEARAMQGRWNLRTIPRTQTWSTDFDVAQAAEVAVRLGTPLLTDAYDHLARSHSPLLMAGTGIAIVGPRDELLARIAERLGRHEQAAAHRERAYRFTQRFETALGTTASWPLTPRPD